MVAVRCTFRPVNLATQFERFVLWASEDPTIIAVALVGSHARGTATEKSDIDLIILASSYTSYLNDHSWLSRFGNVERSTNEQWGRVDSVRVFYETGVEIEFGFAAPSWVEVPLDAGTRQVVQDGFKILFDPKGVFDALQRAIDDSHD